MVIKERTWLQLEAHIPSAESVLTKFGSSNHIVFDLKTETSKDTMLAIEIIDTIAHRLNTHNYSYLVGGVASYDQTSSFACMRLCV